MPRLQRSEIQFFHRDGVFEPLEARALLSVSFVDAGIDSATMKDLDADGRLRSFDVVARLSNSAGLPAHVRIDVQEFDPDFEHDPLFASREIVIEPNSTLDFRLPIITDLFRLPGDDADNLADVLLRVSDFYTLDALDEAGPERFAALGDIPTELAGDDLGLIGARPILSNVSIEPLNNLMPGTTFRVSGRVGDALPGRHGGLYTYIDYNRNSRFDPDVESIHLTSGSFVSGTSTNALFTGEITLPSAGLPPGNYRLGVLAFDNDSNLSNTQFFELPVRIATDRPPTVSWLRSSAAIVTLGSQVTLRAAASDAGGSISAVTFFHDRDKSGGFTPGVDIDLGFDATPSDGFIRSFTADSTWTSDASAWFAAAARDNTGNWSTAVVTRIKLNRVPILSSVTIREPGPRPVGGVITVQAAGGDDFGLQAVRFFFDADNNNRFTPSVDVDLGTDFDGSDGFSRAWIVQEDWVTRGGIGPKRFLAVAVDSDNVWGDIAGPAVTTLFAPPRVLGVAPSSATAAAGLPITFTVDAFDPDSPIRAVTVFFDLDSNNRFTPGDIDLGADFDGSDGWAVTRVVPSWWGSGPARFVADAVDTLGNWSLERAAATVRLNAAPVVGGVSVSVPPPSANEPPRIAWGDRFTLSADVTDDSGPQSIRAVTFFFDLDSNGMFTPGDVDLGADFDGSDGWSISRTVPAWWGAGPARFAASAVDTDGSWSFRTASTLVRLNDTPRLTEFAASPSPITLGSQFSLALRARDLNSVAAVTFFIDVNNDGRWTAGTDIDLGAATRQSGTGADGTWSRLITANFGRGTFRIMADAADTTGAWTGTPVLLQVQVI
jgi:hypothetical protein